MVDEPCQLTVRVDNEHRLAQRLVAGCNGRHREKERRP
jgi:hypothetical protein